MSTLTSVNIQDCQFLPLSVWTSTFRNCDMLKQVSLPLFHSFIQALKSMTLERSDDSSSSAPWLPALTTLRLQRAFFEKEDEGLSNLLEVLPQRSAAGHPLLKLTVETGKYRGFGHYLGGLKAVVPNLAVEWIRDEVGGGAFDEGGLDKVMEREVDGGD
ncbi:hypothetical protein FA13DRAFT_1814747 [Coprinellus micaceus]|uniref:Uncharacterized protein n=1 Tax=Coprinellus micaceus TaxID=71717 RepID=A0A4Y7T929_COPMI|nr:hypothetical protein FA13DRAFT_1814747 [Coprinellus micaceus]